jgi:hypothetical protein
MRVAAGLLVAWALMVGLSDARTAPKPNLKVATVRTSTKTVVAGAKLSFTDTTSNTGSGNAARSSTGFFLSADARKDSRDRRVGGRAVPALKKGKRSKRASSVGIPGGQAAGSYHLIVCADERRKLREAKESDNCRVAAGVTTVTRPVVRPTDGTQPAPSPGDQPPPGTGTPVPPTPTTDPSVQTQALRVVSAVANSSTSATVTFDRDIDPASVAADGSQFTADNGLTFSAAAASGSTATLTSSVQSIGTTYTVTVAGTVHDTPGTGVGATNSAMFDGFAQPTAFRFTDLDLRDPHVYVNVLGARDITDNSVGGSSVNGELQSSMSSDDDGDGYLDRSPVNLFRTLGQAAATSSAEVDFRAQCTATATITCSPGVPTSALASNQSSGTCLDAVAGTTTAAYSPEITNSSSPCFSTAATILTLDLAGIPLTLHDAQVAATYVGDPATSETNGLIRGFITETDANSTIIPASFPVAGGQPFSSLLPGGQNCPASHDDRDVHNGVTGWWFYLNFTATQTAWKE